VAAPDFRIRPLANKFLYRELVRVNAYKASIMSVEVHVYNNSFTQQPVGLRTVSTARHSFATGALSQPLTAVVVIFLASSCVFCNEETCLTWTVIAWLLMSISAFGSRRQILIMLAYNSRRPDDG